ncbi:DNA polymerase [Niveomyces insectorum RCEF 264]|uniref:DNA polymerase n=1 Tax=Niveomyces insectorum RCEF 264 TaxID=1081102 RepID=A0A167WE38_9HYPO|nr:DNA polymerase [Niveomyces insectorum RCEF 264]
MGKRKRSAKADAATTNGQASQPSSKRARVEDDENGAAATVGVVPFDKEALLSNKSLFPQELSRADHDRERLLYKLLGSADVEDRIRAADVIVTSLLGEKGVASGASDGPAGRVSEAVLLRHLDRRLLRGLASGNEAARVGFSYVLSELLGQLLGLDAVSSSSVAADYPNLTFDRLLGLLLEKTRPVGNVPGQEERDHYWGQLFGLQSFVEAGVLFPVGDSEDGGNDDVDDDAEARSPKSGGAHRWNTVLGHLLQLGNKKVWLRSQACFVIVQAIVRGHLPNQAAVAATLKAIASADSDGGQSGSLAKTPEGLGIWLAALTRFPDMALPAPWTAPLAPGSHKDVVAVLRNTSSNDDNDNVREKTKKTAVKQGNASAQLHFVWDLLLNKLITRQPKGAATKQFDSFWVTVVDQVYFAKGASDHQKLTGFKIFQKAFALCADKGEIYPALFSSNMMTCLMNQAVNATTRLHRAAVQALKTIEKQVENQPGILTQVVASLLGCVPQAHGVYDFDDRVKGTGDGTRPVERILRFADASNVDAVIRILRTGAVQAPDPNNDQKALRVYADYLYRLVSRASISSSDVTADSNGSNGVQTNGQTSVVGAAFQALADVAYPTATSSAGSKHGKDSKKKKTSAASASPALPELNEKTQTACRKCLLSAAGALLRRSDDFGPFCRTILAIEPGADNGVVLNDEIQAQVVDGRQQLKDLFPAFDDDNDAATATATHPPAVHDVVALASRARQGLAVLLAVSLLQLYHEPRPDALEVLQDIKACGAKLTAILQKHASRDASKKTKKHEKKEKRRKAAADDEDQDAADKGEQAREPDVGQVLTEVLLAMLAESSPLTRQASLQVFEAFTPFLSAEALDNLTDILAAEENTSGYRALFNQEDEEEEEEDEDEEDDVEMMDMDADGDVQVLTNGDVSGEDDNSASEDSDDDSEESSGSGEDESEEDSDEEEEDAGADDADKPSSKKKNTTNPKNASDGLEAALMKTFRAAAAHKVDGAGADGDNDNDSDNESDMSDDAMLALDAQLAGHLKLLKTKTDGHKKEREEARSKVIAFKHRVLDLLETYVKKEATASASSVLNDADHRHCRLVFRLLLPLVVLIRDTKEPALAAKALRIVQEAQRQRKKGRTGGVAAEVNGGGPAAATAAYVDEVIATLAALHAAAANDRGESRALATAVSMASLTIASTLVTADRAAYHRVADVYRATQDRWVLDGWSVRASLFTDWYNWCQAMRAKPGDGNGAQ